jgi:hypothetical protein
LYITGMNRSGSTALERLLTAHEGMAAAGEVSNLWLWGVDDRLCSCGVPVSGCEFWTRVRASAFGATGVPHFAAAAIVRRYANRARLVPLLHHPTTRVRSDLATVAPDLRRLYDALDEAADGRVVIDSSKYPAYGHLLVTAGVRAAFVHLVRDSRAVAHSFTRRRTRPEIHWKQVQMTTASPAKSAIAWDVRFAASAALRRSAPFVQLRYEDFAADPGAAAARIDRLLHDAGMPGLGPRGDDADPRFYHSVQGNPMRFDKPFRIRVDDEWRTTMRWPDKAIVTALTAPFLTVHHLRAGFG